MMKIFQILFAALILGFVSSQVIGIDLGTQYWKASLISPGKNLVIVQNSRSSRKSHNGIAFLQGIRHFEYDAFSKRMKKPKNTYFYLNKLLESLDNDQPLPGYKFQNGTYYFTEGEDTFSLQQLVGMIMKNIKKFSSSQANSDIKDAVLTVPAHWGFKSKIALVNAASIADMNILGLVNENSAVAIHFAITRNDSDPINIGFFNLGSHNLQITIAQFFGTFDEAKQKNIESLRILSHVSVPDVGGLKMDTEMAEYIVAQFQKKHNKNARNNERSWVKLLHKCSDIKEILSSNKEAGIYIQGFMDGIDLNVNIKREVLERSSVFQVIKESLQKALDKAQITKEELNSVEIIGGASRVPMVNKIVKDFFDPVEVGSHINGDQSMAFGAALRAANLSIAFRVKQLHFYDGYPEEVRVVISNTQDGVLNETFLFDRNSQHGLKKDIIITQTQDDLKATLYYGEDIIHEYIISNVSSWQTRYNSSNSNFSEPPHVVLTFASNTVTIAELKDAFVSIKLNITTTNTIYQTVIQNLTIQEQEQEDKEEKQRVQAEKKVEESKEEGQEKTQEKVQGAEETKEEEKAEQVKAQSQKATEDSKQSNAQQQQSPQSQEQSKNTTESESSSNKTQKPKKKRKTRTRTVPKTVQQYKNQSKKYILKIQHEFSLYKKYIKQQVQGLKEIILKYEKHQNYIRQRAKVRNDFESTLYSLKDDFDNPGLKTFSTEAQLQKLKDSVKEQLEWLEENAWTAQKVDFQRHYKSIKRVYNPIVNRSQEYRDRQKTYNQTIEILSLVYSKTQQLNNSQPWVSEKALNHLKKVNETVQWLHQKIKEQINRKYNEDIVFYNHEMIDKAQDLRDQYYLIKMTPRPKAPRKPKENKEEQAKKTSEENIDLDNQETSGNGQKQEQNKQENSQNQQQNKEQSSQNTNPDPQEATKQDL